MTTIDCNYENENRSHKLMYPALEKAIEELRRRYTSSERFSPSIIREMDLILEDFASFPLGQHILLTGGANGIWTDYLISPQKYLAGKNHEGLGLSMVERFLLFNSPAVLAQRELHHLLQKTAQDYLKEWMTLASIPCGLMRDFLSLDYGAFENVSLAGIDIDNLSMEKSKELACKLGVDKVTYARQNAWCLEFEDAFDFISSIGLNVYESDKAKVIELYKAFHKALKPGGILFTGVLTWPPYLDKKRSDWKVEMISKYDMYLESMIHGDILNIQWFNFRTLDEAEEDFLKAGFKKVKIIPDSRCIFPAVIAYK